MSANDELEHYMTSCSRLKAERDALQARVEEAEGERDDWKAAQVARVQDWDTRFREIEELAKRFLVERDEARALAERRKEALVQIESMTTDYVGTSQAAGDIAKVARAAIEEDEK